MLILSEVRVSKAQQASLARRSHVKGYQTVWSAPPPATSTASLSPGGTAIIVKTRLAVSELRIEQLDEWFHKGRICAAEITADNTTVVVIAMYGFAPSHPERHLNEAFLSEVAKRSVSVCPGPHPETQVSPSLY